MRHLDLVLIQVLLHRIVNVRIYCGARYEPGTIGALDVKRPSVLVIRPRDTEAVGRGLAAIAARNAVLGRRSLNAGPGGSRQVVERLHRTG
jgi:hypothetical protein